MNFLTFQAKVFGSLIFALLFMASCKSDHKTNEPPKTREDMEKQAGDSYIMLNQDGKRPGEVTSMRKVASGILASRVKEAANKSYTIMDKDIWIYDGVVSEKGMKMRDSLGGRWIDFKEDLTYEYGRYDKKEGRGKYFYHLENGTLLLIDDNEAIKPQEFEVKHRNDMMVIVGMSTYEDNNLQAKLVREATYPAAAPSK